MYHITFVAPCWMRKLCIGMGYPWALCHEGSAILATANTASRRRGPFCPRLCMRRMNTLLTLLTNSFWLPSRHYTQDVRKIPDFTKKAQGK